MVKVQKRQTSKLHKTNYWQIGVNFHLTMSFEVDLDYSVLGSKRS